MNKTYSITVMVPKILSITAKDEEDAIRRAWESIKRDGHLDLTMKEPEPPYPHVISLEEKVELNYG